MKEPAEALARRIAARRAAARRVAARRVAAPRPVYDPSLPITACRDEILAALDRNQVLIVAGATGSGKTTQLPKLCLEAGRGIGGLIGCTQPRRIAAQAMAARVAEELGCELGTAVGYQVRFRDRTSPDGFVKFMTDGILLAETAADPRLAAYDTLIIDEAHERSLNIDFLLGCLKNLLPRRPDLKLIVTSATIDTAKFADHFSGAPVIEVSGRGYPVDIVYQPFEESERDAERGRDLYRAIAEGVRRLARQDPHADILVFLSGEREIREAGDYLSRQSLPHTEILPLYARLSAAEQSRVFHPGPLRRIILSTNVAETSLTVPRIRCVIDSGFARVSRYSHRSRVQRLHVEPISQASADQRAGRCGRLGPGTCIRLYSEEDFAGRPQYTDPEVLRTSLGSVILRLAVTGFGDVETFPFIDRPAPRMINEAVDLLVELGAMTRDRVPTALGRRLDRWPVDVRIGRMILEGDRLGCLEEVLLIAAALSIQDPRERPNDAHEAADASHRRFTDTKSDFAGLLRLWDYLRAKRHEVSGSRFRALCGREFLNWQRVLEWFDLAQQLRDQAREEGMRLGARQASYEILHQALLSGLLSHVGSKHPEDPGYQGARGRGFHVFPGSGLFGRNPRWIMAAEIVETSRPWGRIVAEIAPEWIERTGAHLLRRHYADPHWSRKRGAVVAFEQVSLYGLVVVERRRVDFARVDPVEARRIFLREALVRGELDTRRGFIAHNQAEREAAEALEHRRRRHDVLADEEALFAFFDARVPGKVVNAATLEKWLARRGGDDILEVPREVLLRGDAGLAPEELYPAVLDAGGRSLALDYRFEPGSESDGVTVTVPLEWLNTLATGQLQWLVPGLLREKIEALIRSLQKPLRRALTPVPAFADALWESLADRHAEPLLEACARELTRMSGLEFRPADFHEDKLPKHLLMRILVLGENGAPLAAGRDLVALQEQFGSAARERFMRREGAGMNIDGARDWVFGTMPERVVTPSGAMAWPALVEQRDAVGLRLFDAADEARAAHAAGVLRLLEVQLPDKLGWLRRHAGVSRESQLAWAPRGQVAVLVDDLVRSSLAEAAGDTWNVRDASAFSERLEAVRTGIGPACRRQAERLNEILPACARIELALARDVRRRWPEAAAEVTGHLGALVYPGFLAVLAPQQLQHFPRYLAAIEERLRQLAEDPVRDRRRAATVEPFWHRYLAQVKAGHPSRAALEAYRWQVEEFRVSVFAQRLGTAGKVSAQRLEAAWRGVLEARGG